MIFFEEKNEEVVMRDLQQIFEGCIEEIKLLDIPIGNIESIEWAKFRNKCGLCTHHISSDTYDVKISSKCKDNRIKLADLKNIIFHEIIHTCDGCFEHTKLWVYYAAMMDENFGYSVATAKTDSDFINHNIPAICEMVCKNCGGKRDVRKKSSWNGFSVEINFSASGAKARRQSRYNIAVIPYAMPNMSLKPDCCDVATISWENFFLPGLSYYTDHCKRKIAQRNLSRNI